MDLGNPIETIVYYLLIGGMTCLCHRDEFPMMSSLVYMFKHWTGPKMHHDVRLLVVMNH